MGTWTGSKRGAGMFLEHCRGAQKACPGQLSAADTSSPMVAHGLTKVPLVPHLLLYGRSSPGMPVVSQGMSVPHVQCG